MPSFTLETQHGLICITSSSTAPSTPGPTLLLIHGNSSSSKIFRHLLANESLTSRYRMITFCLSGHGASSKAPDPQRTYHMRGYADLAVEILKHMGVQDVVVFGWSLGGHVGIEMLSLLSQNEEEGGVGGEKRMKMKGLMITGTPPALGKEEVSKAFKMGGGIGMAGEKDWTDDQAAAFARGSAAANDPALFEEWMLDDARGTDGRARMIMGERFLDRDKGGVDQRRVVEESEVCIAVVNGAEEQYVDLEYLEGIRWRRLWRSECVRLEGLHHAPFWEDPEGFAGVLGEFMGDVEKE